MAIWLSGAALTGCRNQSGSPAVAATTVRDSAGIRIVENAAPRLGEPWRLSAEPVIEISGHGPPDATPLDPVSVFQTDSGLLVVGDGNQSGWDAILVYDEDGHFLRKMGGPGEGPGEFGQLWWAAPYRGDSLIAMDQRGWIVRVFDESGGYARSVEGLRFMREVAPGTYVFVPGFVEGAYANGDFLAFAFGSLDISPGTGPAWYTHDLIRVDAAGAVWDTLGDARVDQRYWDGERQGDYQFGAQAFKVLMGSRTLLADNTLFEYRIMDERWQTESIVRRSHAPEQVTGADRDLLLAWWIEVLRTSPEWNEEDLRRYREDFADGPHAPEKPAYSAILVDDENRVWVEGYRRLYDRQPPLFPGPSVWSVFDPNGTWLTTVETPEDMIVTSISHDRVFGFRIDELDVKHIEVYDLIRPEPR